jgi:EpsI family protein
LELFIAYYAEQRAGESIHTPKHCLPGAGWEFTEMGTSAIPFGSSQVVVNNYLVQQGQERLRILYWYHSRTRVVANEYAAKFYLARDALLRGSTDGAIVKIVVRDQPGAARKAEEFAASLLPAVQRCFNQQR